MASSDISTDVRFDDEILGNLKSFDDVLTLFRDSGLVIESSADYGAGFTELPDRDKGRLVGVPFVIVEYRFGTSDEHFDADGNGRPYVVCLVMTRHQEKYRFTDGGTGIFSQLVRIRDGRVSDGMNPANVYRGIMVPNGLTRSDYKYINDKGETSSATTFYLSE